MLQHSRLREDAIIADSVSTMAAMNLGDVAEAERRLRAAIAGSEDLGLPMLRVQLRWKGDPVPPGWAGITASAETGGQGMVGLSRRHF